MKLDQEDIKAIAQEVRAGMLQVSKELSDFFIYNGVHRQHIHLYMKPERSAGSAVDSLYLEIEITDTSMILTWMAYGGMILDRFMFVRPHVESS